MDVDQAIDLTATERSTVLALLERHLPGTEAWVYGSRAKWTSTPQSDLDLVVFTRPEQRRQVSDLREAFEESNLPFRVDLFAWAEVSELFRRRIESERVTLVDAIEGSGHNDWRNTHWGDLVTLEYGRALRGYDSAQGAFRVFGTNGPIGWHDEALTEGASVIVGRKGAYRGIHYSLDPCFVIDTAFYLKPKAQMDVQWAYYALLTQDINGMDSGSAIPSTSRSDFYGLPVSVPPRSEQHAIAHILGTLDAKIELNRRMNETLEAMGRALFKSWFVDFEPVRAKMDGHHTGLPNDIADLFPDRLMDSELGEIPQGWFVRTLGDLCHRPQYGHTASARSEPVGPRFLRITDINKESWVSWSRVPYCEATEDEFSKYRLTKGDVLIARMADPGHGILVEENVAAVFASYLIRFKPIENRDARLLQYWLKSDAYWRLVRGHAAGTTRVSLNARVLSRLPLVVPPSSVASAFAAVIDVLRDRIVQSAKEMQLLVGVRDTLLPKLILGNLRVNAIEQTCRQDGHAARVEARGA